MKISIELSEDNIRTILSDWLNKKYSLTLRPDDLQIEVKSKQNFKSEWEHAAIRINQAITMIDPQAL